MHGADIITCVSVDQSGRCAAPDSDAVTSLALSLAQKRRYRGATSAKQRCLVVFLLLIHGECPLIYITCSYDLTMRAIRVCLFIFYVVFPPFVFYEPPLLVVPLGMRHYYNPNKEMGWLMDECNVPLFINAHFTHCVFIYLDIIIIYF